MLPLVAAVLLASPAHADPATCAVCCAASGMMPSAGTQVCAQALPVFGEGSSLSRDGDAYVASGLWLLTCGQTAAFDPLRSARVDHAPAAGEIVESDLLPAQAHCFAQSCALPTGVCIGPADALGRWYVVGCADGFPPGAAALRGPVAARFTQPVVVLVDGRPLVAERVAGPPPAPVAPNAPTAPVAPAIAPAAPYAPTAPSAPVPPSEDAILKLVAGLPADPGDTCRAPAEAVRGEARSRVDAGDEKRIRKDPLGAISEYRAALSMDACNGYGWLGLGETAASLARPDLAIRALRNATRLLPNHYGAFTLLGRSYEDIGQRTLAAEAYRAALRASPSHAEARAGLQRVEGP
jgi:tetratricopeptide (TPR) repeat protein